MLAVKSYSVAELADVIVMLAKDGTAIVPALNGVTAAADLEGLGVPRAQTLGGTAIMNAHMLCACAAACGMARSDLGSIRDTVGPPADRPRGARDRRRGAGDARSNPANPGT